MFYIMTVGLDYCYITGEPFVHVDLWNTDDDPDEGPISGCGSDINPAGDDVVELAHKMLASRGLSMCDVQYFKVTNMYLDF